MNNKITKKPINHGTISKPFGKFHTSVCDLMPFYPVHWHEEVEIMRVVSGSGSMCIGGVWLDIKQGDIIIIPPFVLHTIDTKLSNNMAIDTIVFNLRLLETSNDDNSLRNVAHMLSSAGNCPVVVTSDMSAHNSISMSLDTICLTPDDGQSYMLAVRANLYWVFYHLYVNKIVTSSVPTASPVSEKKLYTIKRVIQHIHANYKNNISIDDIAYQSGYSQFYIMKMFKQYAGSTIVDYINSLRLDVAGMQILSTDKEIATIATLVGYNNISYFNRQFLSQYGTTPKQFRQSYQLAD